MSAGGGDGGAAVAAGGCVEGAVVSAFAGFKQVMAAYQSAMTFKYRFFSYGDAMWIS